MKNYRWAVLLIALLAAVSLLAAAEKDPFKPLFNGKDWAGFKPVLPAGADPANTWRVKKGVLICSGKPNGYLVTEKSYKNYTLLYDWMYVRPAGLESDEKFNGNSGCLIHITGEHKIWPKCIEVQGMNKDHGNILAIGGAPKGTYKKDAEAQKKAIKPIGEWNTTEIVTQDGKVSSKVNGVPVAEGSGELAEGPIGFQSEGAEIHFRNIQIKEMK